MLGKLFVHEMRALAKPAGIMLGIMLLAGIIGIATFAMADVMSDGFTYSSSPLASNGYIMLFMVTAFCGFVVWAGAVALFVFIVMRFYRTMFTDEGYLTLTLPVPTGALVAAKFLAAYLLMAVAALLAIALYSGMLGVLDSGGSMAATTMILSLLSGTFGIMSNSEVASVALGTLSMLVGIGYNLALAFGSLTLGAWWARRHKVAAAVGVYVGISWLLSLVFSIVSVIVAMGGMSAVGALGVVTVFQTLLNAVIAVGFILLTSYLVRAKVDLS